MALPDSGEIKLSQLATQFGGSAPHSLKEYYRGGGSVSDNASNASVPQSGEVSLKDFYSSAGTQTRDIRVWMAYQFSPFDTSGFGVTSQSSTAAPSTISNGANAVAWQPVFHAGTGFITSASITISQNEDVSAYNNNVVLYGGLTSSTVTNVVAAWNAGSDGHDGGDRSYSISWNADGTINSITYIGGNYNVGIITWATDNVSAANSAGYKWFGFYAKNPPSFSKGARVLGGTFRQSSAASITQPS
tara:strand:- start:419 stop:1156 length:738 start_codon:yes stop_codon:yes gene_type:complete